MLSEPTFAIWPLSCGCPVPSITSSHNMEMVRTERIHVSIPFVYGVGFPCSGYRSRSLALFLMHRFSFSNPFSARIAACGISALPGNNMLHFPSGFPSRISCRMMSCLLLFWSLLLSIFAVSLILVLTACSRRHFIVTTRPIFISRRPLLGAPCCR